LLNGLEIKKLTEEMGKDFTTTEVQTTLLGFSGDTPVEDFGRWDNTEILIHEATFLTKSEYEKGPARGNKHSTLEEVMEMVGAINIGKLILGHFSSRYTCEQIDREIKRLCEKHAINIPVFRVLPGETARDILRGLPLNK
jgi:ribonuclease Z